MRPVAGTAVAPDAVGRPAHAVGLAQAAVAVVGPDGEVAAGGGPLTRRPVARPALVRGDGVAAVAGRLGPYVAGAPPTVGRPPEDTGVFLGRGRPLAPIPDVAQAVHDGRPVGVRPGAARVVVPLGLDIAHAVPVPDVVLAGTPGTIKRGLARPYSSLSSTSKPKALKCGGYTSCRRPTCSSR